MRNIITKVSNHLFVSMEFVFNFTSHFIHYFSAGVTTPRMVVDPGWILLMKGVSGVPGDLYQLWSNTAITANPNVPAAQSLTDDFLGHYKPEIANYWQMCSFDRVSA